MHKAVQETQCNETNELEKSWEQAISNPQNVEEFWQHPDSYRDDFKQWIKENHPNLLLATQDETKSIKKHTKTPKPRGKLLIVDDEEGPRQSLRVIFKDEYDLFLAEDGPTALELARQNDIDVTVTNIRMPGMSGIELLERLKYLNPDIEVIMMTGFETMDTIRESLRLGACDYINKPFLIETIRTAVSKAMQHHELKSEKTTAWGKSSHAGASSTKSSAAKNSMHMKNTLKTKILIVTLAAFILTCLFPPWLNVLDVPYHAHQRTPAGHEFILFQPDSKGGAWSVEIDLKTLFVEWAALAAITGTVWVLVVKPAWSRDEKPNRPQKFIPPTGNPEN